MSRSHGSVDPGAALERALFSLSVVFPVFLQQSAFLQAKCEGAGKAVAVSRVKCRGGENKSVGRELHPRDRPALLFNGLFCALREKETAEKIGSAAGLSRGKRDLTKNKDGEKKQLREDEEEEPVRHKELRLRNYDPEDEELKKRKVPQAKPASVEEKVKEQLEAAKPEPIIDECDLANLAPRKPDWDLKRDVAKKLEKLEKRTQRAIAELIRERLKGQEGELASAVGSAKQDGSDSE
ncbi:PREDICTED: coiled-coil domain-containing protein 12 [Tinamus guttatus]|uniref:coiled-coil domain-containing protein 12 n=1 Tax=Tinamus guttatus TaxID=94827 RepID=UPI00052EA1E3|nr:PREDICTED: coiled-coil domain-containing protein 12 [Tinamus guttatus]